MSLLLKKKYASISGMMIQMRWTSNKKPMLRNSGASMGNPITCCNPKDFMTVI